MTSLPTQQDVPETPALAGGSSWLRSPQIHPMKGSGTSGGGSSDGCHRLGLSQTDWGAWYLVKGLRNSPPRFRVEHLLNKY